MSNLSKTKALLVIFTVVLTSGCISQEKTVYEGSITSDIYFVDSHFEQNPLIWSLGKKTNINTRTWI